MSEGAAERPAHLDRARLFVALDLPESVRAVLVGWRTAVLEGQPALRPVPPEALHVTLCFLGWRDAGEADAIGALVAACAGPVGGLVLGEPLWLPRRRPRVLAVELGDEAGALRALQDRLSRALARAGVHRPERRPYLGHVTVARVRSGARPTAAVPPPPSTPPFAGASVALYRSRLAPSGARYEVLARTEL